MVYCWVGAGPRWFLAEWAESDLWAGADVWEHLDPKKHTWEVRDQFTLAKDGVVKLPIYIC